MVLLVAYFFVHRFLKTGNMSIKREQIRHDRMLL